MPNFTKGEHELETRLDKWLYFIKNLEDFRAIPEIFKNEVVFIEAMNKAELSKMNETDLGAYYAGLKAYRDNINTFNTAIREAREEAEAEGKAEGKAEGIEIGEANKEKYADEKVKKEKLENAKNCLKNGLSIEMTMKITGLTEKEIKNISI